MGAHRLDDIDQAILYRLQENARQSMTTVAEDLPVSANTVRNRIQALEESGVIAGYHVHVDYAETAYSLLYQFTCSVSISDRKVLAEKVLTIPGVIEVSELMTGQRNLVVRGVAREQDGITRIAQALDDEGITVVDETLMKRNVHRPLTYFDTEGGDGEE